MMSLRSYHHYHHHLFWKGSFLPCWAGVRHLPHITSLHIFLNIAHTGYKPPTQGISCHPLRLRTLPKSSCPCPHISPPPNFCNHPHSQDVQTFSICHVLPHQPHNKYPEGFTNPPCTFYPSKTLHTSISPLYFCPFCVI